MCGWGKLAFFWGGGELAEKMVEDFFKSSARSVNKYHSTGVDCYWKNLSEQGYLHILNCQMFWRRLLYLEDWAYEVFRIEIFWLNKPWNMQLLDSVYNATGHHTRWGSIFSILGLNFISLCFKLKIIHYHTQQNKGK